MSRPCSRAQPGGRKRECTSERSQDGEANARRIGLGSPRATPNARRIGLGSPRAAPNARLIGLGSPRAAPNARLIGLGSPRATPLVSPFSCHQIGDPRPAPASAARRHASESSRNRSFPVACENQPRPAHDLLTFSMTRRPPLQTRATRISGERSAWVASRSPRHSSLL